MSNSKQIINQLRKKLIEKYNLNEGLTTNTLLKAAINQEPKRRQVFLRIVYLLNQTSLSSSDLESLEKLTNSIK